MNKEAIRKFCLALPGATEDVQWEHDLLFRIGGKMFAVTNLEPAELRSLSFKCVPEAFGDLIEREGIDPNKYLKRYGWVTVTRIESLTSAELRELLRASYEMVRDKLPKKLRDRIAADASAG
jgi:predicted DNA-binding protein (MmcQ/YjbR family)